MSVIRRKLHQGVWSEPISRSSLPKSVISMHRQQQMPPSHMLGGYVSIATAIGMLDGRNLIPSATGPAGPILRANYCIPQCYGNGKRDLWGSCRCKRCYGAAHGRKRKFAFDHGNLKSSPPASRRPPSGHEPLFPEEPPAPIGAPISPNRMDVFV